jgi:hypothetical protein
MSVPAKHQHCFDLVTFYCVSCGQSEKLVAEGRWPESCPATEENSNLVAISHLVRAKRLYSFARKAFADAYCGA